MNSSRTSRKHLVTINSLPDLLGSFLLDLPPDYRFETARLRIYPIEYFLPHLRVPTPLNTAPFSYLIIQGTGSGVVQVNADLHSLRARAAIFVNRGSVVSLRAIHPSTTGWIIMYDDAILTRVLRARTVEQAIGPRSPIALSAESMEWIGDLCGLLERQVRIETGEDQPVSDHLFAALVKHLLAEGGSGGGGVEREFRRLLFEYATTEGSVGFYARRLNVSENYLLRCVRASSGRSPKEWILDVRLMRARTLLRTTDASVGEIAARSGFDDPSYFGRLFRRRFGMSPKEFRTLPEQDSSG